MPLTLIIALVLGKGILALFEIQLPAFQLAGQALTMMRSLSPILLCTDNRQQPLKWK